MIGIIILEGRKASNKFAQSQASDVLSFDKLMSKTDLKPMQIMFCILSNNYVFNWLGLVVVTFDWIIVIFDRQIDQL